MANVSVSGLRCRCVCETWFCRIEQNAFSMSSFTMAFRSSESIFLVINFRTARTAASAPSLTETPSWISEDLCSTAREAA